MATKTAAQKAFEASQKRQKRDQQITQAQAKRAAGSVPSSQGMFTPPAGPKGGVPVVAPQPFDPDLELRKLQAGMNVGLSDAEATYQRGLTAFDTGYDASGARNYANPYAQAQLLEDQYKRDQLGTSNSYAAMGQYSSGAYGRAKARDDRLYAQGSQALSEGARRAYHGIGAGQLGTYASNSLGVSGDAYASLRKAIYGS